MHKFQGTSDIDRNTVDDRLNKLFHPGNISGEKLRPLGPLFRLTSPFFHFEPVNANKGGIESTYMLYEIHDTSHQLPVIWDPNRQFKELKTSYLVVGYPLTCNHAAGCYAHALLIYLF